MRDLLVTIARTPGCRVIPVADEVDLHAFQGHEGVTLPTDLQEFLRIADGVELFTGEDYALYVHGLSKLLRANPVIVGEDCSDDLSYHWFLIANDGSREYLTIDLSEERNGRCYDSFSECHGVVGSCAVVSTSFTDLLQRALQNKGQHWWWLQRHFASLGDAYDD